MEGERYQETKDLDIVEVAKLIRKDLAGKREEDDSPLYGLKVSVQIQRYSMGQAIHLTAEVRSMDRERWQEIKSALFRVAFCYNRDDSDPMSDYYNSKFHIGTHVRPLVDSARGPVIGS